jgi:hypothetical protein
LHWEADDNLFGEGLDATARLCLHASSLAWFIDRSGEFDHSMGNISNNSHGDLDVGVTFTVAMYVIPISHLALVSVLFSGMLGVFSMIRMVKYDRSSGMLFPVTKLVQQSL